MTSVQKFRRTVLLLGFPWILVICLICIMSLVIPGIREFRSLRIWDVSSTEDEIEETPIVGEAIDAYLEARPVASVVAPYVVERSGSIDELGGVHEGVVYPGDNANNQADFQGFMTFDLSVIPINADVEEAVLAFESCTISGFPFREPPTGLGVLAVDVVSYGDLDQEDYAAPTEVEVGYSLDHCPPHGIDVTDAVLLTRVQGELQFRLSFVGSNKDPYRDDVTFAAPSLTVLYLEGEES